jgi:3-phenylpropionate/cinnamic acid dioxygenase small subunit
VTDRGIRTEVAQALYAFQRAFDEHDWPGLTACLAAEVRTDYGDLRATAPAVESAGDYVARRELALDHLDLQHNLTNVEVEAEDGTGARARARARANFQIYRFERDGDRHFHSWGTYHFSLERTAGRWRITAITQRVLRNDGDPSLHRRA